MKRIGIILGLLTVAVIGLIALFGDQRTRTLYLAPEASDGWKIPVPIQPSKIPHKSESACQMLQLYPGQCWIFPQSFPAPSRVEYQDSDVRILVVAGDMNDPDRSQAGYWERFAQSDLAGKVLLHIAVWKKRPITAIALDQAKIRCADASNHFQPIGISYHRYVAGRVLPIGSFQLPEIPGLQTGALLISATRQKLDKCVLLLNGAVKDSSMRAIPDLKLHSLPVAYYRVVF